MRLDVKKAIEIAPTYMGAKVECARLEKAQAEAQERMKTEVVGTCCGSHIDVWLSMLLPLFSGKLKDLGNMFLSNFGLSVDNFQAKKDPATGSYSINFQR